MVPAKDISRWQGGWQDTGEPIVMIKIGGGDAGLYYDAEASSTWPAAVAAGKAVGGYWFIGWTMGAAQEAAWFLKGMAPRVEGDVYALDIEAIPAGVNPVPYVEQMVSIIHSEINVYPLVYMNLSTLNAYDWSGVLNNCGLWLADWAVSPQANIPTNHTYVMQQYSDGPNYDHDMWFGTIEEFKQYGYHAPEAQPQSQPAPAPSPAPAPAPAPVPEPTPTPSPQPQPQPVPQPVPTPPAPEPTPAPRPTPTPVVVPTPKVNWFIRFLRWLGIIKK